MMYCVTDFSRKDWLRSCEYCQPCWWVSYSAGARGILRCRVLGRTDTCWVFYQPNVAQHALEADGLLHSCCIYSCCIYSIANTYIPLLAHIQSQKHPQVAHSGVVLGVLFARWIVDARGRAVERCLSHACSAVAEPARAGVIDVKPNPKNNRDLDIRYILWLPQIGQLDSWLVVSGWATRLQAKFRIAQTRKVTSCGKKVSWWVESFSCVGCVIPINKWMNLCLLVGWLVDMYSLRDLCVCISTTNITWSLKFMNMNLCTGQVPVVLCW